MFTAIGDDAENNTGQSGLASAGGKNVLQHYSNDFFTCYHGLVEFSTL